MDDGREVGQARRRSGALCVLAVVLLLLATLWPFDPHPPNNVRWLKDAKGIRFSGTGLVLSSKPLEVVGTEPGDACSLELLLRPANIADVFTIVGFYSPNNPKHFMVRQWTDGLLVTNDVEHPRNEARIVKFDVDRVFQPGKLVQLTITGGPSGTVVYVNGRRAKAFSHFTTTGADLSGRIVMGTSPVYYDPWSGEVHGLAIYAKELSPAEVSQHYANWMNGAGGDAADLDGAVARYSFGEGQGNEIRNAVAAGPSLVIQKYFNVPYKALLTSAVKEFQPNHFWVDDVLINIAGFVPLGMILYAYLSMTRVRPRAILVATLIGCVLSLTIEILQAYIPARISGTTDIITNTTGTALGAWLARTSLVRAILARTIHRRNA